MLKAVLHGKAGRIEQDDNESVSWRKLFKSHEDLMTAAVLAGSAIYHLKYKITCCNNG